MSEPDLRETFEQLDELRRHERRVAMATLVSTKGTTPRKEGAKMWVGEDGRIDRAATALRRTDMRRRGLPKDRPFARDDYSDWGGCPYCDRLLLPHPEAEQMARDASASGLSRWRCC